MLQLVNVSTVLKMLSSIKETPGLKIYLTVVGLVEIVFSSFLPAQAVAVSPVHPDTSL